MALPTWPAGVPSMPLLSSHSIEPYLAPLRTEMDGGNIRQRARPGDDVAIIQQTVVMTPAQYDELVTWGKGTIGKWTGRFTVKVWLGSSCATKTCMFDGGAPRPSSFSARRVAVSMKLRVFGV